MLSILKGADLTDKSCSYRIAAEQKARSTYDNLLRLIKDPDVYEPIKFLRAREIVHFQRFGEANRTRWNITSRKRVTDKNVFFKGNMKGQSNDNRLAVLSVNNN